MKNVISDVRNRLCNISVRLFACGALKKIVLSKPDSVD